MDFEDFNEWQCMRYWFKWAQGDEIVARYVGVSPTLNEVGLELYLFELIEVHFQKDSRFLPGQRIGLTSARSFVKQMKNVTPGDYVQVIYHGREDYGIRKKFHEISVKKSIKVMPWVQSNQLSISSRHLIFVL